MDAAAYKRICIFIEERSASPAAVVQMPGVDLRGADLWRADLAGADLRGALFDRAALVGAKLSRARLEAASFEDANLNGATLHGASLAGANLAQAAMEGAKLSGADLRGACLRDLRGKPASLAMVKIDAETARRSEWNDAKVIQIWREGADLEPIDGFSAAVRRAVRAAGGRGGFDAEEGPSHRTLATIQKQIERATFADEEAPTVTRCVELRPRQHLLGVRLERRIGGGSAASVWRGVDASGEPVVIKVFEPRRAESLAALARGVHTMNRLMLHAGGDPPPGIARLRCVSVTEQAFTTDPAAGNLRDIVAFRWSVPRIVRLVRDIAEAVAFAHGAGVVHKCLKPSNVLLTDDLCPVVTDFDMADLPALRKCDPEEVCGYGPYAAPEELLDLGMQSPTADVFSVGRLLQFLLTGEDPDELLVDVPRLASIDRDQPAGLVRIIRKCTMLDARARYQWMRDLIADLDKYDKHDEVGIRGNERNFLAHRISTVVAPAPPPRASRPEEQEPEIRLPDAVRPPSGPAVARKAQLVIGVAAAAVALGAAAAILLYTPAPRGQALHTMSHVIVGAVAIAFFALWRQNAAPLRGRLAASLASAMIVTFAGPSHLLALRSAIYGRAGDAWTRAEAVRVSARAGKLDMRAANLSDLDLKAADLTFVDLRGATLVRASFRGAELREARLAGADMTDAIVEDTDLALSDAPDASGWRTTLCSPATRMPKGWTCSAGHHPAQLTAAAAASLRP